MSKKIIFGFFGLVFILVFFSSFHVASAAVSINEIMYDLEGADTGREWIEVYNNSDSSVDLSTFKFFEADTNHALVVASGESALAPHGYAVIVSDPEKFQIDWPNFSGSVFDSSFSLSNEGEALIIKDENLNVVNEYSYLSSTGAAGDGKSLQLVSGVWKGAPPTPGKTNEATSPNTSDNPPSNVD